VFLRKKVLAAGSAPEAAAVSIPFVLGVGLPTVRCNGSPRRRSPGP